MSDITNVINTSSQPQLKNTGPIAAEQTAKESNQMASRIQRISCRSTSPINMKCSPSSLKSSIESATNLLLTTGGFMRILSSSLMASIGTC